MKKIMIDMDHVITDGTMKKYIEDFLDVKIDFNNLTEYMFVQDSVKDVKDEFWEYVKDKDFYQDATLIDGCYEVLEKLSKEYELYIVTAYLWRETYDLSAKNLVYKYNYLKEKLPFIDPSHYVFATNKNIMSFDVKIDDCLSNLENADTKILFGRWHNKDISKDILDSNNVIRVNNWYDIEEILLCDEV